MSYVPLMAWRVFIDPPPGIWNYWYLLILPPCLALALVYKSIRCASMRQVPREATVIFLSMVLGLGAAAGVLYVIVRLAVS